MKKFLDALAMAGIIVLFVVIVLAFVAMIGFGVLAQMGVRWNITL